MSAVAVTLGAMSERMGKKEWVLVDTHDAKGSTWRAVSLTDDGAFAIRGHDLGTGPEGFWGSEEYEFERRYSPEDAAFLSHFFGQQEGETLIDAFARNFESLSDLTSFLDELGYESTFWSRVGN